MAPPYRVVTAYTPSQYREYNRTIQRVQGRLGLRLAATVAVWAVIGALSWVFFGAWYIFAIFTAWGLILDYLEIGRLRKAEDAQCAQEMLSGTVTYVFGEDSVLITSAQGEVENPYGAVTGVLERDSAFYIMFTNKTGAILPKEDCPADLEAFIRSRFDVKRVRRPRIGDHIKDDG